MVRACKGSFANFSKKKRARDLVIHGPAHCGANGEAMPTDEDDKDGHFFL